MPNPVEERNGATICSFIHDACIERDLTIAVGICRETDATAWLVLGRAAGGFNGVERPAAFRKNRPCGSVCPDAAVPGRDHDREFDPQ